LQRASPDGTSQLQEAAKFEVLAWQAAWQGDWERATDCGKQVVDQLAGGRAPQRYAAFWNFLLSCWVARIDGTTETAAASGNYFEVAFIASRGTTWIPEDRSHGASAPQVPIDNRDEAAAAVIVLLVSELSGSKAFHRVEAAVTALQSQCDYKAYEAGLVALGSLLGAESVATSSADSAPDATWLFGETLWVCWEAKNEATTDQISSRVVRQAGSHLRYTSHEQNTSVPSGSFVVLATAQTEFHPSARKVAEDCLYLNSLEVIGDFANVVLSFWTALRSRFTKEAEQSAVLELMREFQVLPSQWTEMLSDRSKQAAPLDPGDS